MSIRLTPTLNDARNDTGRTAYCGPTVISAITGYSISKIEAEIHAHRGEPEAARKLIVGTTAEDVAAALAVFGYGMQQVENFEHLERKQRPTVWQWMQRPRSTFAHYVLGVSVGKEGHWICIKGTKLCDTYTQGRWVFVSDGPHRGARVWDVFRIVRIDDVPGSPPEGSRRTGPARKAA